ncbi:MAG: NusG domain II-containing protein [Ruminococcaceae bacterium]|nr:NusG domain II-containing protein [Oscillospiraceae bacterium]
MNHEKIQPTVPNGGRKLRNDIIFIVILLTVLSLAGLAIFFFRGEGDTVTVEVDGAVWGVYSLSEDRTIEIYTGSAGEALNLLVIRDGKAYVETATCPDGICAAHRPISHEGESIVCLPHKVVITVSTTESGNSPDIVA